MLSFNKAKRFLLIPILLAVSFLVLTFYQQTKTNYLTFSDGAKFADIARNVVEGKGFVKSFSFFSKRAITWPHNKFFEAGSLPPLMPYSIAVFFKLFGVSDFSVIFTSAVYYLGVVVLTYFLARGLFNNMVGIASSLAVATNLNLLDYATSGASEIALIFLVLLTFYFLSMEKKRNIAVSLVLMFLLYLTRPQAIIYIFGFIFYILAKKTSFRKALVIFIGLGIFTFILDRLIIYPLSYRYGFSPLLERGFQSIAAYPLAESPSDALRGAGTSVVGVIGIAKKLFYNLFNFYKRIPDIMSPYLFFLFILGLFVKDKGKQVQLGKFMVLIVALMSFFAAAVTIPFFRYVHPVVPLVYIFGIGALFNISRKLKLSKIVPLVLTVVFVVGLSLLNIAVEARFIRTIYNLDKPPAYVLLSKELESRTTQGDVVITNLDTWGSWYGDRKTIWLPLKPEQLIPSKGDLTIDAIYITNYLIDDENYYLGDEWGEILNDPVKINESVHGIKFEGYEVIEISPEETFENIPAEGVIIWRKDGRV